MTHTISDISPSELDEVTQMLAMRYRNPVVVEPVEAEIQVDPEGEELASCPGLYWEARGAHFVVFRFAEGSYRGQFYYSEAQQYSTGRDQFGSLQECVTTLLQVQADHERQMAGLSSGLRAADSIAGEYDGPSLV